MEVTEYGIVNQIRLEHKENALSPIDVTELGTINKVRFSQPENAPSPMELSLIHI